MFSNYGMATKKHFMYSSGTNGREHNAYRIGVKKRNAGPTTDAELYAGYLDISI